MSPDAVLPLPPTALDAPPPASSPARALDPKPEQVRGTAAPPSPAALRPAPSPNGAERVADRRVRSRHLSLRAPSAQGGPALLPLRASLAPTSRATFPASQRRSFVSARELDASLDPEILDATCGLRRLLGQALQRAGVEDFDERTSEADGIARRLTELFIFNPSQLGDALEMPEVAAQLTGVLKGMLLPAVKAQLAERAGIREKWTRMVGGGRVGSSAEGTPAGSRRELNKPLLRKLQVARVDVTHLAEIDQISQTFYARLFVILTIKDGVSDSDLTSDYAGFPFDEDGRPTFRPSGKWYLDQIDFPNGKSVKTIESKVTKQGNDLQLIKRVEGHFFERFKLHSFPFDGQDLTITISANCACEGPVPVEFVDADTPQLGVDTINFPHGDIWDLSPTLRASFATVGASARRRFPAVHLRANVRRRCGFVLINAAMPVSTISFLSLTTFFVPPEDTADRLELSLAVLLTAVAFKFTTSSYLPQISYMTLVDIFTILSTLIIVAVCLCHTLLGILDRWAEVPYEEFGVLNKVFLAVMFAAWVAVQLWFVYRERRVRNNRALRRQSLKRQSGIRDGVRRLDSNSSCRIYVHPE